ncbi:MAG: hypothetical protein CENE_00459 [Candidatus Celerinatantimonas neptuna]|nr:MAG: hypothetical protein CENE_00459 [Candidatus Celerinatantimonas neptuna]
MIAPVVRLSSLIRLLVCLIGPLFFINQCHAYGNGLLPLSADLQIYHHLMVQNPALCLQKIDKTLHPSSSETLVFSTPTQPIMLHQIAALCANRDGQKNTALNHINQAIQISEQANQPLLLLRSSLIKAQLLLEAPSDLEDAQLISVQVQQDISQLSVQLPLSLSFQLALLNARIKLAKQQRLAAKDQFNRALQIAELTHNPLMLGWAQTWLGIYHQQLDEPEQALLNYTKALRYVAANRSSSEYLRCYLNHYLSEIYRHESSWDKALEYQRIAISSAQRLDNKTLIADNIASIAHIYQLTGQYDLALVHYLNAQDLAKQNHYFALAAKIDFWLGQTYQQNQNDSQALAHLNIARRYFQTPMNPIWLIKTLLLMGEIHIANNEPAIAILQLTKAESLAAQIQSVPHSGEIQQLLSIAYEQTGAYPEALAHFKQFHRLSQQYQQLQTKNNKTQFSKHYQLIELQQQLDQLVQKNRQIKDRDHNRRFFTLGITGLAILLIILCFMMKLRLRRFQQQRRELADRLYYHPRTGWPALEMSDSPLEQLRKLGHYPMYNGLYPSKQHVLFVVRMYGELFTHRSGFEQRKQLGTSFAHHIYHHFGERLLASHLGGQSYLFIAPLGDNSDEQLCQQLQNVISQFIRTRNLQQKVAIGCCTSPFLTKAEDAINDQGLIEIAHLALDAAIAQVSRTQEHQWVILKAIQCSPAAFFQSEHLIEDISEAIRKGLVKVISSTPKDSINW